MPTLQLPRSTSTCRARMRGRLHAWIALKQLFDVCLFTRPASSYGPQRQKEVLQPYKSSGLEYQLHKEVPSVQSGKRYTAGSLLGLMVVLSVVLTACGGAAAPAAVATQAPAAPTAASAAAPTQAPEATAAAAAP